MKKNLFLMLLTVVVLPLTSQTISVDELSKIIKQPNVIVVDARPAGDYLKTHINGAVGLDATTLCNTKPVEGTLKSTSELASILGKNGISNNSKVVIYCKTGVNAGRLYWILKYLGHEDVSILDGQMDAWFAARKPITKNPAKPAAVTYAPKVNASIYADKAYVKSKLSSAVLIDSRPNTDYAAGKIGEAVNIPSESLLNGSKLKPEAELNKIFTSIPKNKEVIVYCKTGVTASFVYYVMKSVLKYPNVRVYEGAYLDWTR